MGLGVYLIAELPRRGWLRKAPRRGSLFKSIVTSTAAFVERQPDPVKRWMSASVRDDSLEIDLFPAEENVEFSLSDERIVCSAKTSTAGPGYHAYLIDLLDHLEHEQGLIWDENLEDSEDETGFRAARDFGALQTAMADWLRGLANHVTEKMTDFSAPILLGMPMGFAPRTTAFAASPMGEWSREWLGAVAAATGDRLLELASEFFGWWERGASPRNLRGFGLVRSWMEVKWTAPQDSSQRDLLQSVAGCFEDAARLDPTLQIPAEAEELRRLLAPGAALAAPNPTGIGFLRRPMACPLTGGWTVDLPGYFLESLEEDGSTQVYSFRGKTVRGSSLSLKGPDGATAADLLGDISARPDERPLAVNAGHLAGKYTCKWDAEEGCHLLHATVAKVDGLCVVTIAFDDEKERPWAESVATTIFAPEPD